MTTMFYRFDPSVEAQELSVGMVLEVEFDSVFVKGRMASLALDIFLARAF